ncbi:alpha/beta fold hydrolase [Streptomyces sp. PmtG]
MSHGLHCRADGPATAPPLLLGPSLGTSTALWDAVTPLLSGAHRVLRWDLPGHGGSPPDLLAPGARVADLADLVLDLADRVGLERFAYAGVSLGGAVGLHLAVHHRARLTRLAVVCSSARFGDPEAWRDRAALVRREGLRDLARTAPRRWFTPGFTVPRLVADHRRADPGAYAACCDALAAYDLRRELPAITTPTVVVAGREDRATPPAHGREIAAAVPRARYVELRHAAHLAPAERPEAVARVILGSGDGSA